MANSAPPVGDTKKPATAPPAKAAAGGDKAKGGGASAKPPEADKSSQKTAAPSAGQDKAKGAAGDKANGAGGDKAASAGQQRFDRMAVRTKLAVSEPGDALERQADDVAARVMRAPAPGPAGQAIARPAAGTAKAATGSSGAAKNEPLQRKAGPERSEERRGTAPGNAPSTSSELLAQLGAGAPLDVDARAFFEQRLGRDLSDVRIHHDAAAADAARTLQARAFTWGNHIAFASGEYQPGGQAGRELLAHELAHVMQNDTMDVSAVVHRKTNPKYADPNEVSEPAMDPALTKKARPDLQTLALPAIKARHADIYKGLAKGKSLKRPAGYDRKKPAFETEQVSKWKKAVDLSKYYSAIDFTPGAGTQWVTFYGNKARKIKGTEGEIVERLKIPTWAPDGLWRESPLQVDHVVEVQLSGADEFSNYELLTGAHNTNVGSLLRAVIYANVQKYLSAVGKNSGKKLVEQYLDENDVPFERVEAGREGRNPEGTAQFWSRKEIQDGKHLIWLQDEKRKAKDDGTHKDRFALYSYTGEGFIDAFPLKQNTVSVSDSGRLAGIKVTSIDITANLASANTGPIGTLNGVWELPKHVTVKGGKTLSLGIAAVPDKKYAGKLIEAVKGPSLEVKGASPVEFGEMEFVRGKLSGEGVLTASHELFSGLQIPVRWRGDELALEYTVPLQAMQGKLPVPGLTIDQASLTLFLTQRGFGADGMLGFTVAGLGAGVLTVGVAYLDGAPELTAEGEFTADRKLFDEAVLGIGYSSKKGFYGKGTLAITQPGKIKGLKSARLSAKYESSVFSATGEVIPDIPGLKAASLSVTYGKDVLEITGKVSIDDKVPGVEKADITVNVKQADTGWKVAASGQVTPKLPGLSGAQLEFSYDDGSVLVEGEFAIKKGPLDGKVKAGITNAEVDDKGVRTGKGSGHDFKVFGAADIRAEFIKDKLDGMLKLRLLPDGSVRVGGGLTVRDFQIFDKIPSDGGVFFDRPFSTPAIPVPGLGFSVGPASVGLTLSASLNLKAWAALGPGKMSGITLSVAEFDPANIDLNTLEIGGGATFQVFADAGFSATAMVNLKLSALVASLSGGIGVEASVGIPPEKPILTADSKFTYSQAKGLDIMNTITLDISPELKFKLKGEVKAELELLITSITVWSRDFTLAEASYKLPVGIKGSGSLGYNTKTGKLTPEHASDAINIDKPNLDADAMKGVVMGDAAPPSIKTTDKQGKEVTKEAQQSLAPVQNPFLTPAPNQSVMPAEPNQSVLPASPNQSVMPRRDPGATAPPPPAVDESIVNRLGTGAPLDLSTRGFFEQRMKDDLTGVRIHVGPAAAREAERLQAEAFTVGDHIAFASGEYQPETPEGQELIAHELAHVVQQRSGGGEPIVMRWPAVTRTSAQTTETPASIRARSLSDFVLLTQTQLDWATSPALQADAAALAQFRDVQTFADGPHIVDACGDLGIGDIIAKGVPGVYPALRTYTEGSTSRASAWLRHTNDTTKAERWGSELSTLEGAWSPANLSLVMRAPDPVASPSPFERLENPASPELPNFISYLGACSPILSAEDGSEIDSFLALRREGAMPQSYLATIAHVKNFHHFTKATLDGLANNEAFPQWRQRWLFTQRPLSVVLYPAVDHNGAFHRNLGLQDMVTNADILTIVVEGLASVADYQAQLAPVAARYGINGEVQQAMIGGHGNATILVLAGTANAAITSDSLGTAGASGASTTNLMTELTRLMSGDPAKRRIVLDACLTNSHHVASALRASPADAAADVNAAITANPSLRDVVAGVAGPGANVFGSNSSFVPAQTTFMNAGGTDIGLSVPGDPDLIASKIQYVEFGSEPEGCMRAVLECWSADQIAGTHDCRDAMVRRIAGGRSAHVPAAHADSWRESIIQPLYDLAVNHYWGNGDAIRQLGTLAGRVFELYMPGVVTAGSLAASLAVLGGNAAHIDRLFTRVSAEPTYTGSARVAIVIEQAWMQHTPARRAQFIAALGRYTTCLEASADVDMALVMAQAPALLAVPPPVPLPAEQLRLALMAAHHAPVGSPPPSPLPAHAEFLRSLLGAGPTFPVGLGISAALGGLASETQILVDIGRPIAGAPGARVPGGPPPAANIDTERDATARNDFHVTPLRLRGVVNTVSSDLMVRSTPTTSTDRNIFSRLPAPTAVVIVGEWDRWYAIEQPGRTGFVAKRYVTLVP